MYGKFNQKVKYSKLVFDYELGYNIDAYGLDYSYPNKAMVRRKRLRPKSIIGKQGLISYGCIMR